MKFVVAPFKFLLLNILWLAHTREHCKLMMLWRAEQDKGMAVSGYRAGFVSDTAVYDPGAKMMERPKLIPWKEFVLG